MRGRSMGRTGGFLVEAEHVACRIAKARGDLWCIPADGLDDLAAVGDDGVDGRGHAVHHDVNEKPRLRRRRPAAHPTAAHFADRVVERKGAVAPLPDVPAEYFRVEVGRATDVCGRDFYVTDLAVRQ